MLAPTALLLARYVEPLQFKECLDCKFFGGLLEAQNILEHWHAECHDERLPSSLRHQTPSKYAQRATAAAATLAREG